MSKRFGPLMAALGIFFLVQVSASSRAVSFEGPPQDADVAQAPDGARRVVIFHTNDIHGQVLPRPATWLKDVNPIPESGGLPRLAGALSRLAEAARQSGAAVVICDGGDWFQGTPEGQIERGRGFLNAFAKVGFDGCVVGNHEFDHGVDVLLEHLAATKIPALLANVRLPSGEPLPGTRDSIVVERAGLRIGLVGFLTTTTPSITHKQTKDLLWESPAAAYGRVADELGDSVDLLIPVCHVGVEGDRELARAHPSIPVIIGGHSHTFLRNGVREGDTLVTQAGAKASVIGRVDLTLDEHGLVIESTAKHLDLYDEPLPEFRNGAVDALCANLVEQAAARMDEVVGVLGAPLGVTRRELVNSTSGNFITDQVRARSGADIAVHNRGGIRTSLQAGPVTRRHMFMLLPFDNHVETITMSGADVIELFRQSIEEKRKRPLEFSGAVLQVRRVEGKPVLVQVLVDGEPLDPSATVRLATNNFLSAGGDGWELFAAQTKREVDFVLLRDLLELAFNGGALSPNADQRYEVIR